MSLKKLNVADVTLGMFVHSFDGPWLAHPFWKTRFLLDKAKDLHALRNSQVTNCWIDTSRGIDLAVASPIKTTAVIAPASSENIVIEQVCLEKELKRAGEICKNARGVTESIFRQARLGNAVDIESCVPLVNEITASVSRNTEALISLARLKHNDNYTYMHSVAVCALMVALAKKLGMDEETCRDAGMAGLLHDIGKSHVPIEILNKPGKLTDEEFEAIQHHPVLGFNNLAKDGGASKAVLDVCLHHHEKIDGSGYPHRLKGEEISLMARMGAICDVYDAITSDRPYKSGWDPAESVAKMISWHGHFDAKLLAAFVKILGIYPTGALVRMNSGRIGVVVEQNPASLTRPVVKVFFSGKSGTYIPVERIDLHVHVSDAIAGSEPREKWDASMINSLWAGVG